MLKLDELFDYLKNNAKYSIIKSYLNLMYYLYQKRPISVRAFDGDLYVDDALVIWQL